MPFRFFRTFRAGPFRMNLSKGGVSWSVGREGAWLTVGRETVRTSVGIPGTGLGWYERRRLSPVLHSLLLAILVLAAVAFMALSR